MSMEILVPGALTTIQDMGRRGYASRGVQENGACDKFNYLLANVLACNPLDFQKRSSFPAVLEMTLKGCEILFQTKEIIALTGADMKPTINGRAVPMYETLVVEAGDILTLGMAVSGLRTYLAVYGGINVKEQMGSRSTSLKCHLGGLDGRALKADDILDSGKNEREVADLAKKISGRISKGWTDKPYYLLPSSGTRVADGASAIDGAQVKNTQVTVIRTVLGPQEGAFTKQGMETFLSGIYHLSPQSDRMGCKLSGSIIETVNGSDIISDGIVEGSIQVSSDGMPMVMMADHQTTGGYAKIATVISADIPRMAQKKPGEPVAFACVTPEEAANEARKVISKIEELEQWMKQEVGL